MNAKHYVSLEVAKMLKEKGYNEEAEYAIDEDSEIYQEVRTNRDLSDWAWQCPTLLEAMDWLDDRGIIIIVGWDSLTKKWLFLINRKGNLHVCFNSTIDGNGGYYTDRNECMNAAIKKGLELLC